MANIIWLIFAAAAFLLTWIANTAGHTILLALFGTVFLFVIVLKASETILPILLLITLALGSAYRFDIAASTYWARFLVLGLIALRSVLFVMAMKGREKEIPRFPVTWVHASFLLTGLLGVATSFYSVEPSTSLQRAISFLLLYVVVFFYFWIRTIDAEACMKTVKAFWWSGIIVLGIGYLFLFTGMPGMFRGGRLRLVLFNPNQLGHYSAFLAPVAFWYFKEKAVGKERRVALGFLLALGGAILGSGSRAGLVAVGAAMLVLFTLCYRKLLLRLLFLVALAGSLQLLFGDRDSLRDQDPSFLEQTVLRESQLSTGSGRTEVWKAGMRLVERRPWFGYGFGIVDRLFDKGYFPEMPLFQGGHIHNSYIEELVNLGWVGGGLIYLAMAFVFFSGLVALLKVRNSTPNYRLTCALFCVIIVGMISAIFESWFTSVGSVFCFPFWLMCCLLLKMTRHFNDWEKA